MPEIDLDKIFKTAEINGYTQALIDVMRAIKDKPYAVEVTLILGELHGKLK